MIKMEKNEDFKKLLDLLGAKEIGFVYSHQRNDYISCSCGCQTKITNKAYYKEDGRSHLMCPECGTKFVYEDLEFEKDSMAFHYSYKITQDDENFMVMLLDVQGICSKCGNLEYKEEELDFFRIVYDKKEKFFFVATNENYDEEITEELVYDNAHIMNKDGDDIARLCTTGDLYCYGGFVPDNCFTSYAGKNNSGLYEIADEIGKRTGWKSTCESDFECLESLLTAMFVEINTKWYPDYTSKMKNEYGSISWMNIDGDLGRATLNWLTAKTDGIDMNATTIEEAFGMSLQELASIDSKYSYLEHKKINDAIKNANLSDLENRLLRTISYSNWSRIINLADSLNVRLGDFIIHIARGIQRGCEFRLICDIDEDVVKNDYFFIDFKAPFTRNILAKYYAVAAEQLTSKQYDAIAKKPTLDTIFKELVKN